MLDLLLSLAIAAAFVLASRLTVRASQASRSVLCLAGAVAFEAWVLLAGYFLSAFGGLGSPSAWLAAGACACVAAITIGSWVLVPGTAKPTSHGKRSTVEVRIPAERWLTGGLAVFVAVQLLVLICSAPSHWDSLTYHLPRAGYALQAGSLERFDANYWAQVDQPWNATVIIVFAMQIAARSDALVELPQFASWLTTALAAYVLARSIGTGRSAARMAAALFALSTHALTQAITVQSDPLVTANLAIGIALVSHAGANRSATKPVWLAGLAIGISIGVKPTAIVALPSLAGVLWVASAGLVPSTFRLRLGAAIGLGLAAFALPSGYVDNYQTHGHIFGSEVVRQSHTFEGVPVMERIPLAAKNAARFAVDAASTECRWLGSLDQFVRGGYAAIFGPLDLETTDHVRHPFRFDRPPGPLPDHSYCGLVLPLFFLPALGFVLWRWRRAPAVVRWCTLGIFAYLLTQSAIGPYDPWRGRYATIATVLATTPAAWWIESVAPRRWLACATVILLIASADGVQHGGHGPLLSTSAGSRLERTRLEQLTASKPSVAESFRQYQQRVPAGASIVVAVPPDSLEYLAFGEHPLRYRLLPCGTNRELRARAERADFALVHERRAARWPGAESLGAGYWLWRNPTPPASDRGDQTIPQRLR